MSRMKPRPKHPTLGLSVCEDNKTDGVTYMQKKGEIKEDNARARTEK